MLHGLNALVIRDVRYLLVGVSSSHLARLAQVGERRRGALAEWRTGAEPWAPSYDLDSLRDPIWNSRTLCGLEWVEMEPGDGPLLDSASMSVHAPSCRNCLRIVSGDLESVAPDDRIPLIVGFVVDEVLAEAGTVVTGVPGEQLEQLRSAIREALRRLGIPFRTYSLGGDLHVVSEGLWDDMAEDRRAAIGVSSRPRVFRPLGGRTDHRAHPCPGMEGKVTISHAFCLCDGSPEIDPLLEQLAEHRIGLATVAPGSVEPMPLDRIIELGINICLGQDGVRDLWSPWGDADMLSRAGQMAWRAGYRRDEDIERCVDVATWRGAAALGHDDHRPEPGGRGHLVLVDAPTPAAAAVIHPPRSVVVRDGVVLQST